MYRHVRCKICKKLSNNFVTWCGELSKSLVEKLKHVLPDLISPNQTANVKNRCISESGRLISDVIESCDILDIPGYLVTMGIGKAFDSLDHDFLLSVFKKMVLVKSSLIG